MKTNLLKLAAGICFAFATVNSASAQTTIVQEDFDYPVGNFQTNNGGIGWAGPWRDSLRNIPANAPKIPLAQIAEGNIGANTVGNHAKFTSPGGWDKGASRYRDLESPIAPEPGTGFWLRFSMQATNPVLAGLQFWNVTDEVAYFGANGDNHLFGIGNKWADNTFTGPRTDQLSDLYAGDLHNYVIHVSFPVEGQTRFDVWADYEGLTTPVADDTEETFKLTAWDNAVGGITLIKVLGLSDVTEYDGIRITDIYAPPIVVSLEDEVGKPSTKESNASFYPNPVTNGELNVVANKESLKSIAIFDLTGRKVASQSVSGSKTTVNTQGIAKGVYILEVNGSKSTSRNKLVID